MNFRSVKNLSRRKIAPHSDVRVGATLQDTCEKNKTQRIGTWNVRTMLKTGKLENIKIEMKRLDIDILGLCEIRWPDNGDFWSDDIRVIHTNSTRGQAGVGIALNKKWGKRVTNVVTYSSRLCLIKIESTPNNLVIIQVYMPTSKADDEEVEEVYAGIEELIQHTKPHDNVIIMGDFNAIVGKGREGREVGDFGLGKRNARGERVVKFCRENGMIITNTRFQNPKSRIYTWKMPGDIARYQIDYILVKNRFKNQVKFCKTYPSADCDSDHNIVIAKCELRYKKPQRRKVQQDNYNVRLLKRAEIEKEYGRYMDIEYQKQNVDDPPNKNWKNIKSAIKKAADSVLTKKENKEPRRAWIDKEIVKLIDERRKYKNNNTREGQQKYRQLRNQVNR
ncbi:craniofacial development protein 2-like [Metopolophium dirhodum]|uniref:craniofacial development protein 2-like n=1 Tax=Metopolophium dirhodum TaxID=44670 RepID=UPI00298F5434|nr:craniofacial development protein 2-like [Metopolophium dirhodum]